jgi:hypothetical protein
MRQDWMDSKSPTLGPEMSDPSIQQCGRCTSQSMCLIYDAVAAMWQTGYVDSMGRKALLPVYFLSRKGNAVRVLIEGEYICDHGR